MNEVKIAFETQLKVY